MIKIRINPCLDVDNGRVVKGINFVNLVDAGDPVKQAKFYKSATSFVFHFYFYITGSTPFYLEHQFPIHINQNLISQVPTGQFSTLEVDISLKSQAGSENCMRHHLEKMRSLRTFYFPTQQNMVLNTEVKLFTPSLGL